LVRIQIHTDCTMLCLLLMASIGAPSELVAFASKEWSRQPEMRIEDAYKWLFHATLGGEHAVTDDSGPRQWMEREWKGLGRPLPKEPEVQSLRPDGKIVRINLRPFKGRGGESEMLLAIFVESAKRFRSDKKEFVREWMSLGDALRSKPQGKLTLRTWSKLDQEMKPLGYPAVHHSQAYETAYRPAYRVILRDLWAG
jgi:hypothetical protein